MVEQRTENPRVVSSILTLGTRKPVTLWLFFINQIVMTEMRLHPKPFERIKAGEKTEEYRVFDAKRRQLEVNDYIRLRKRPDLDEVLLIEITSISVYPDFGAMYEDSELKGKCKKEEFINRMRTYYSEEKEKEFGAVKIGFRKVEKEE